jgi:hypothetical protein
MRIVFDQATPVPIRRFLEGHIVRTAAELGWAEFQNGADGGEEAGFGLLVTTDKNIWYRQNLTGRKIAIVVLGRQQWPELRPHVQLVVAAIGAATPGSYCVVQIPTS